MNKFALGLPCIKITSKDYLNSIIKLYISNLLGLCEVTFFIPTCYDYSKLSIKTNYGTLHYPQTPKTLNLRSNWILDGVGIKRA